MRDSGKIEREMGDTEAEGRMDSKMEESKERWVDEALQQCLDKIERNISGIGRYFPHVAYEGRYNREDKTFWTAGVWPGILSGAILRPLISSALIRIRGRGSE